LIDDEIKFSALAIVFISAIIIIYPLVSYTRIVEPFSYMGLLNVNGLPVFPKSVVVGENLNFNLEIGNYEGKPEYYKIIVKVGDQINNVSDIIPLNAPIIKSYETIITKNQISTINISLNLLTEGINRRIVFELYKYDINIESFAYFGWTQVWLNVTTTS
jgi:hypothetical protein